MAGREDGLKDGNGNSAPKNPDSGGSRIVRFFKAVAVNWRLVFTLALLLLIALMYQWKIIAVEKSEQEKLEQKRLLTERAGQVVIEKNKALMRLTAIPLSWVVRTEITRGGYDNIDQYFSSLVSKFYPPSVLELTETSITIQKDGRMMAVVPVTGLAGKAGVLILVYTPEALNLNTPGG